VVRELQIQGLGTTYKRKKSIFFADDNIIADKEFAQALFHAIKPLNINWMCQASMNLAGTADVDEGERVRRGLHRLQLPARQFDQHSCQPAVAHEGLEVNASYSGLVTVGYDGCADF
jgi:hypothetical protein